MSWKRKPAHRKPSTIGALANRQFYIELWCESCVRYVEVSAVELAARIGPDVLITNAGQGSRCPTCGSKSITALPGSPPLYELFGGS